MSAEQNGRVGEDTTQTAQVDITQSRMTTKQVAELLAVSPRTVAAYAARGQMPAPSACPCCGHSPTWERAVLVEWARNRPSVQRAIRAIQWLTDTTEPCSVWVSDHPARRNQ